MIHQHSPWRSPILLEITEARLLVGGDIYYAGDEVEFPDDEAKTLMDAGWAKCAFTGKTGERVVGHTTLKVNNTKILLGAK